eukprot:3939463-Rhodomonas_salina.3
MRQLLVQSISNAPPTLPAIARDPRRVARLLPVRLGVSALRSAPGLVVVTEVASRVTRKPTAGATEAMPRMLANLASLHASACVIVA